MHMLILLFICCNKNRSFDFGDLAKFQSRTVPTDSTSFEFVLVIFIKVFDIYSEKENLLNICGDLALAACSCSVQHGTTTMAAMPASV
jgi:hypothetical protein